MRNRENMCFVSGIYNMVDVYRDTHSERIYTYNNTQHYNMTSTLTYFKNKFLLLVFPQIITLYLFYVKGLIGCKIYIFNSYTTQSKVPRKRLFWFGYFFFVGCANVITEKTEIWCVVLHVSILSS